MEKVFLRVYNREIESMIEGGHLDEAVAHCQQILKTFSMHIETYRLLGKAFLEGRRYADAADIFQRVLMAVPDDFVSQVGMSIIRDDEGRLDDAIWHMERAFDVQPSNSAIQGELRRLYGHRDGVEPSKIRLSRAALANMYSQGELFDQAIAEIRSILAEDPNRPDLQVMLMRAYYRSGHKVESAEVAATLLKKYFYCMDALRVLVDVLPGTARAENMQIYSHRLSLLDPYSSFTVDSVFSSEQVADSAVKLERLDYLPGARPVSSPDWASSLGVKMDKEKGAELSLERMLTPETSEPLIAVTPKPSEPEAAPVADTAADSVPDWMRFGSWLDSTGEGKEGSADTGELEPEKPIAKADIPDWLMSMAPTKITKETEAEPKEPAGALPAIEEGFPDWLKPVTQVEGAKGSQIESQEIGPSSESGDENKPIAPAEPTGETFMEPQVPVESQRAGSEDIPDWLKFIAPLEAAGEALTTPRGPIESKPASDEDIPNWLKPVAPVEQPGETIMKPQVPVESQPVSAENVPGWLNSVTPVEIGGEALKGGQEPVESQPVSADNVPEWLSSVVPAETKEEALERAQEPVESQPMSAENVPGWLNSVTPMEIGREALKGGLEPVEPKPVSAENIPGWLNSVTSEEIGGEALKGGLEPVESKPVSAENIPGWLNSVTPVEIGGEALKGGLEPVESKPVSADNVPEWLSSVVPAETGEEALEGTQEPVESQPVSAENVPGWLNSVTPVEIGGEALKGGQEPVESKPMSAENVPGWLNSVTPAEIGGEALKGDLEPVESQPVSAENIPGWLNSVTPAEIGGEALKGGLEPVESQPVSADNVPEWLSSVVPAETGEEVLEEAQKPVESQPVSADNVPEWLSSVVPAEPGGEALIRSHEPVESQPASVETVPDSDKSSVTAETTSTSNVVAEPTLPEEHIMESGPELTPAELPSVDARAFPDWLTGMSAHAGAAATSAAETMEQPAATGEPVSDHISPPEHIPQEPVNPPLSETGKVGESFQPSGEVKPLNIGEDALGWLESLAAEQGAKPEEMLTNPQGRSMVMPDWLRQPGEEPTEILIPPTPEPIINPPETLPLEPPDLFAETMEPTPGHPTDETFPVQQEVPPAGPPTETEIQPAFQPASEEEDTMAWLERLSAGKETMHEERPVSPKENLEIASDVNQEISEEQAEVQIPEESIPVSSESAADEDSAISSWLRSLDLDETLGKTSTELPGEEKPAEPAKELPDWLKDLEIPTAPVKTLKAGDELPEWLRHPIPPTEPESASKVEMPAWIDENIPVTNQAVPTMSEEWVPAEAKPDEDLEPVPVQESTAVDDNLPVAGPEPASETPPVSEPAPAVESKQVTGPVSFSVQTLIHAPTLKQTGMLSPIPVQDKDAELLSQAQTVLDQDSLNESMKLYTKLIKKCRLLDEVIHDLREAIYRYPVDVIIWQTLGDAYMRANRLQDALDAYTKAEELLR